MKRGLPISNLVTWSPLSIIYRAYEKSPQWDTVAPQLSVCYNESLFPLYGVFCPGSKFGCFLRVVLDDVIVDVVWFC